MTDPRESQRPSDAQRREIGDPVERPRPLPWFVVMLLGAMATWGAFYIHDMPGGLDSRFGDRRTPSALMAAAPASGAAGADGAQIYASRCAACHQSNGLGLPGAFPPLAGSEWVKGDDKVLVQIPLHGITGTITVNGTAYHGAMPSFAALSDDEIAAVLSHVRGQWQNAAPPVTAKTVGAGRERTRTRSIPWSSGDEIRQEAAK